MDKLANISFFESLQADAIGPSLSGMSCFNSTDLPRTFVFNDDDSFSLWNADPTTVGGAANAPTASITANLSPKRRITFQQAKNLVVLLDVAEKLKIIATPKGARSLDNLIRAIGDRFKRVESWPTDVRAFVSAMQRVLSEDQGCLNFAQLPKLKLPLDTKARQMLGIKEKYGEEKPATSSPSYGLAPQSPKSPPRTITV